MLLERHHEDRFRVYASALSSFTPSKDEAKARLRKLDILDTKKAIASVGGTSIDYSWLKGASETYQISSDIKDFILQEVPIVTVDFPNRNLHAFPFDEVSYFDPRFGQFIYKTFVGKPTFADHNNKNFIEAKGVHFDSSLRYVPGWDVWKIFVLLGYDRTKDSALARQIEKGQRRSYSMGAWVSYFLNSLTGKLSNGTQPLKYPKGTVHDGKLSYDNCSGCEYFECLIRTTKVKTIGGDVPIEDIKVGDTLLDERGNPIKVARTFSNGMKKVVDLQDMQGNVMATCTQEHSWLTVDGKVKKVKDFAYSGEDIVCGAGLKRLVVASTSRDLPTHDLHVDSPTNLYQLSNGLVTHNTSSVIGPADVSAESHQIWYF